MHIKKVMLQAFNISVRKIVVEKSGILLQFDFSHKLLKLNWIVVWQCHALTNILPSKWRHDVVLILLISYAGLVLKTQAVCRSHRCIKWFMQEFQVCKHSVNAHSRNLLNKILCTFWVSNNAWKLQQCFDIDFWYKLHWTTEVFFLKNGFWAEMKMTLKCSYHLTFFRNHLFWEFPFPHFQSTYMLTLLTIK